MLFSLSTTLPADTQEEFARSKEVFKSILERQLREDLGALIHAKQQVELPWAIGPIAVVNEDTRIDLIERISNSLRWFYSRLFATSPGQSGLLFQPLLEPVYNAAARQVTTAAQLVVHAIIRSYLGFTQPRYHDFVSSVLAREDLIINKIFPEPFADHVATLIEFQNTVRTILLNEDEREVGVWTDTAFKLDLATVAPVLRREIRQQWQQDQAITEDTALLAHLAVALSYENRWAKSAVDTDRLKQQLKNAEQFLLPSAGAAPEEGTLCIFEFAYYAVGTGGLQTFASVALSRLFSDYSKEALPQRAWLSFGRFWSTAEAARFREWIIAKGQPVDFVINKYASLASLRPPPDGQLPTCFGCLDIKAADRFELLFARQLPHTGQRASAWELLAETFHWFTERRHLSGGQLSNLPVAAVGNLLRMLQVIYPELFCFVRISQTHSQLLNAPLQSRMIALPVEYPDPAALEQRLDREETTSSLHQTQPSKWLDPRLVVARYAAAELLNQRLAFGSSPLKFEFQLSTTGEPTMPTVAAGWLTAIEWVENRNHHGPLLHYAEQAASPRDDSAQDLSRETGLTLPSLADEPWALCVHSGGTGIKGGLYPITKAGNGYQIAQLPRVAFSYPLEPEKDYSEFAVDGRYAGGQQFAQRLHDKLVEACEAAIKDGALMRAEGYKPIAIIGLTWPGAVSGEGGHEYVAATSKILNQFSGLTGEIVHNAPAQIHTLRIRENIADIFRTTKRFGRQEQPRQGPLVALLKDSDGHTLASLDQFDTRDFPSGCTIVLTAGTGTALGVLRDGKPLPVLAEASKFIIDLTAPFTRVGNFPVGVGSQLFSAGTFVELAGQLINEYETGKPRQSSLGPSGREMLPIDAIELGIYCANLLGVTDYDIEDIEKYAEEWYGGYAEAKRRNPILPPEGKQDALAILDERKRRLTHALRFYDSPDSATLEKIINRVWEDNQCEKWPGIDGFHRFVLAVTFRAGCLLADLIATADDLFGATTVLATGGPLAGALGKLVRAFARYELEEGYGYEVFDRYENRRDWYRSVRLHGIYFPEPRREASTSPAWGAGKAALELYRKKQWEGELLRLEEWLRTRRPGARVKLDKTRAAQGITRIASDNDYLDIEAADVYSHLSKYKARLGLCLVSGAVDEFIKVDNPDLHVL